MESAQHSADATTATQLQGPGGMDPRSAGAVRDHLSLALPQQHSVAPTAPGQSLQSYLWPSNPSLAHLSPVDRDPSRFQGRPLPVSQTFPVHS